MAGRAVWANLETKSVHRCVAKRRQKYYHHTQSVYNRNLTKTQNEQHENHEGVLGDPKKWNTIRRNRDFHFASIKKIERAASTLCRKKVSKKSFATILFCFFFLAFRCRFFSILTNGRYYIRHYGSSFSFFLFFPSGKPEDI